MLRRLFLFSRSVYKPIAVFPRLMPGGAVFSRKETALVSRFADGSCVVYNVVDRMAYLLNETAGVVIELTDGLRSVRIVAEKLCKMYEIDDRRRRRRVTVDVKRIYRRLNHCGIFSRGGGNR